MQKSFYTTAFANGGKKVYDNCTTLVSDEREKKYFFIQPSTKIETLLATLIDKEPVILKSHLSGANVKKGLKQIRTWTFLL